MLEGQSFEPAGRLAQFMRIMSDLDRDALAAVIECGIERLDVLDGDPDLEDGSDLEPDDDAQGDRAWTEWHGRTSRGHRAVHEPIGGPTVQEDDEQDDDDSCSAGDDQMAGNRALGFAWCLGDDADADAAWPERERQPDHMGGGVSGDVCEDAEPWIVPALEMVQSPANDL